MLWRVAAIALVLAATPGLLVHGQSLRSMAAGDPAAVAAWNRMIAAKGGRERLHAVETLRVTLRRKVGRFTRHKELISRHTELIFGLPDRLWEWHDVRDVPTDPPGHGFGVRLWNSSECWQWLSGNGKRASFYSDRSDCFVRRHLREQLLLYLLETRDFQPVPVRVTPAGRNRERVEVKVPDFDSVAYLVDTRTSMPLELVVPFMVDMQYVHTLGAFREVSGLMMPTKVDQADATTEINLALDSKLFSTPPDGVIDAEAWREPTKARTTNPARITGTFRDERFAYTVDIPRGYWATDVVEQQEFRMVPTGFRMVSTWSNTVLLMSAKWLPSGTLSDAADRWIADTRARFPHLREKSRTPSQLGGLDAIDVVLAGPDESADVNYARAVIAFRTEPGRNALYAIELNQGIRPEQGDAVFRDVVGSFKLLPSR